MLFRQTHLFSKARREPPADAQAAGHRLLARAGYIDQLASGIFSLLPLGLRVHQNVARIIREEMTAIGGQEVLLPTLHPSTLWAESGRLTLMDPPLFQTRDRRNRELVLASTHEEAITDLARRYISSYKDLPIAVFQIQTKFRNELRASGGLLRVREFSMKDLYSFHRTNEDLALFYESVQRAYRNIFVRCDVPVCVVAADSGSIGGSISHEFSIPSEAGEDTIVACTACGFARNVTGLTERSNTCPQCGALLEERRCIEAGHTFQLGTTYSAVMGALFTDENGKRLPLVMGCYGIGVGRLVGAIAETHYDEQGLIWPAALAPCDFHVVALQPTVFKAAQDVALHLAEKHTVLFDDRDVSAGEKLVESDLLGIPIRVIVSEKHHRHQNLEVVDRRTKKTTIVAAHTFLV